MLAVASPIKVFLSHSSADKDLARRLARDLQSANIEVWLDQWEIQVGAAFAQTIEKGVEEATYVLVLLTPTSVTSHWVEREWRQKFQAEAKTQRFSIVPVRGQPCEIPDFLAQRSYADISGGSYPLGFKYLLEILRYHSDGQSGEHSDGAAIKMPANIAASINAQKEDSANVTGISVPMLPMVTPISVEVGVGLIPLFEPNEQGRSFAMDELIPHMRDRLQKKLGFPFPGIRIRGNESDMPPYTALMMIEEVPELLVEAVPGYVVVGAKVEALAELGITGQPCENKVTGQPGSVIKACDRPLAAVNYATWNAAEYLIAILENLLQKMAAEFLTIDTAYGLVKAFEENHSKLNTGFDSSLLTKTVPDTVSWYELTDVLRQLVEEGIGIGSISRILAAL